MKKEILYTQILVLFFFFASSCKNDGKQHDFTKKSETKIVYDIPNFKEDNVNMTLEEYSAMLKLCCDLKIKKIISTNSKGYSDTSIVVKVDPTPYMEVEKGDSVLVYVRD